MYDIPKPLALMALSGQEGHLECFAYHPSWRGVFNALNRAWIQRYFKLEPTDEEVLGDPEGCILALGGQVFFARLDGTVVGTCAIVPLGLGRWEIIKLAVDPACQGRGIGRALVGLAVDESRTRGASMVVARTNPRLRASYGLFTSSGFTDVGPDPSGDYDRETLLLERPLTN